MNLYVMTIRIKLLEDTHVGTGMGKLGLVDSTQERDAGGKPLIPAETLRGVLREAVEDYVLMLRQIGEGERADRERGFLRRLLGVPGAEAGQVVITALRLADAGERELTRVWTSTARRVHSREPMDDTLRSAEYASAKHVFEGKVRLECQEEEGEEAIKCLKRWLRRVTRIGGGKTRGWGRIRMLNMDVEKVEAEPSPSAPSKLPPGPVRLRVAWENPEPLCLPATARRGNIIGSEPFVSGQRLRGALLHWLSRRDRPLADELAQPDVMHVGNAYPVRRGAVLEDGVGLKSDLEIAPLPLSLQSPKSRPVSDASVPWWVETRHGERLLAARGEGDRLAGDDEDAGDHHRPQIEYKRIKRDGWLVRSEGQELWERSHPDMAVRLRNRVPTVRIDPEDRPDEAHGGQDDALFSEESLVERQVFVQDLWFRDAGVAERFRDAASLLLANPGHDSRQAWLRVGRGGRPMGVAAWQIVASVAGAREEEPTDSLVVTLTSDLIARTPLLTFVGELGLDTLLRLVEERRPDTAIGMADLDRCKRTHSICEPVNVYGFSTATGLPRNPAIAIRRGSVFRWTAPDDGSRVALGGLRRALLELASQGLGLGERTEEGFGMFALDLDVHSAEYWLVAEDEAADAEPSPPSEPEVYWQEGVLQAAFDSFGDLRGLKPSVSQWQGLRQRVNACQKYQIDGTAPSVEAELATLREQAKTSGGGAWKGVLGSVESAIAGVAPEGLGEQERVDRAKCFVDALVRLIAAERKSQYRRQGSETE